ncbi:MAG: galactosamine-6-phosphate isomerase [Sediminicola sp.]
MKFQYCKDYAEMGAIAAETILGKLREKPDMLLCAATGNSPTATYRYLGQVYQKQKELFYHLKVIKLDEWGGISPDFEGSCEAYLQDKVIKPLQISGDRYISMNGQVNSLESECDRISTELKQKGPIDLCILGLGQNGHLGLNEPANELRPYCHITALSQASLGHAMIQGLETKPTVGLTLGMADILGSKKIILLVTGTNKEEVTKRLMERKISTDLPASLLWLHGDVTCFVDSGVVRK